MLGLIDGALLRGLRVVGTQCTSALDPSHWHGACFSKPRQPTCSAAIGLRSNKFAILATLKRSSSELSSYQKKMFVIDDNMGIGIAGLVADADGAQARAELRDGDALEGQVSTSAASHVPVASSYISIP